MVKKRGTNPPAHSGPSRRKWHVALLTLAVAAFVAWLVHQRLQQSGFHWGVFVSSFVRLDWRWMAASVALAFLTYWGRALRWAVMLRPLRPEARLGRLFRATAIGFAAVVLLGRPGEFVRPYLIAVRERVPVSSQLAAWFLERILDLLAVLLIFGIALTRLGGGPAGLGPGLQWVLAVGGYILGGLGALCVVLLVMFSRFADTTRRRLSAALAFLPSHHHRRAERLISAFLEGMAAAQSAGPALRLLFYTVLEWVVIVLTFVCLFKAYPVTAAFRFGDVLVFMGFVSFGSVLQIPGVGGGIQIVSILVLTELFGVPLELATSVAITIWVVTLVVIVPPGLIMAFHEGLNWQRLRELEREAARAEQAIEAEQATENAGDRSQ